MRSLRLLLLGALAGLLLFAMTSGRFLVIDRPEHADVIVVLAGETDRRPRRGLELLSENYAPRMVLDVLAQEKIYHRASLEIAHDYLRQLPQRDAVSICPILGLSTKAETADVAKCLRQWNVHSVLLVSSDYHTRRARSIFRHQLPQYHFSVAGASDDEQFAVDWWKHRQWAKVNFNEWLRLVWWEMIDRWQ